MAALRPDAQWSLRLPGGASDEVWADLLRRATGDLAGPILTELPDALSPTRLDALQTLGFQPARTEQHWSIPLRRLPPITLDSHQLVHVTACDPAAVAELDNAIRADIPGTEHWQGTTDDLLASLDDEAFDPQLYLIARHRASGALDGLIRVWNNPEGPRLGCLGVRRRWRRTRLAAALVAAVVDVLADRGVPVLTTETDSANADSHAMAARVGGTTRMVTEWQRR